MRLRCFVAVEPPPELVEVLQGLDRPDRGGLRWTPPEQWHVTLRFFAAVDPDGLVAALDAAHLGFGGDSRAGGAGGVGGVGGVRAVAGPRPSVLGGRAWVVPVSGLDRLAGDVAAATSHLNGPAVAAGSAAARRPERDRGYRGHLTLARARHPSALRALSAPPVRFEWVVSEVVAIRSELGPAGARHYPLGRWVVGPR